MPPGVVRLPVPTGNTPDFHWCLYRANQLQRPLHGGKIVPGARKVARDRGDDAVETRGQFPASVRKIRMCMMSIGNGAVSVTAGFCLSRPTMNTEIISMADRHLPDSGTAKRRNIRRSDHRAIHQASVSQHTGVYGRSSMEADISEGKEHQRMQTSGSYLQQLLTIWFHQPT